MSMGRRARRVTQTISAIAMNAYIPGFFTGRIYQGGAKHICVPGLNCYSCPGALGSCPIGALQTTLAGLESRISLYAAGTIALAGAAVGRAVCGWVCPYGFLQEGLYRIFPSHRKSHRRAKGAGQTIHPIRYLKYLLLVLTVFLLPLFIRSEAGLGETWFCAYVCPAGTIEAAIPLLLSSEGLRQLIGWRFLLKAVIAVYFVIHSLLVERPFCRYLCPLGALYGLCNTMSFLQLQFDQNACISCRLCAAVCPMGIDPVSQTTSTECIRCGECLKVCPTAAFSWHTPLAKTPLKDEFQEQ